MWLLLEYLSNILGYLSNILGYLSNILGYPSKYLNYTSKMKLGRVPIPPSTPQWITFLPFRSQKISLNIKDVQFDIRMGCIIVLFTFLWIINVHFTNFLFFYFKILRYWLTLIQNCNFYHRNYFKTTFTYKIWMK